MSEAKLDARAGWVRRDALGRVCLVLHLVFMIYILLGWSVADRAALVFYLLFLPVVVIQWQLNRNSCVLNNLESLLRTGRWRDTANREEGAWLLNLLKDTLGLQLPPVLFDILVYALMAVLWGAALAHARDVF